METDRLGWSNRWHGCLPFLLKVLQVPLSLLVHSPMWGVHSHPLKMALVHLMKVMQVQPQVEQASMRWGKGEGVEEGVRGLSQVMEVVEEEGVEGALETRLWVSRLA